MGWLWSSSTPPSEEQPKQQPPSTSSTTQTPSPDPPSPASQAPPNRHEQALSDLKELFSQIDPERSERASVAARERATRKVEVDPDSLYSSEMSCSQCFDLAYYCSSVGGQLNNVYRFGGLRSCSEEWAKWRFCMRTKAMSEDTRKEKIREWNQKQAAKYRVGKSSEDIWEVRKEPVDQPFSKSVDAYEY